MNWFFTVLNGAFIAAVSSLGTVGIALLGLTQARVFPGRPPSP